MKELIKNEIEKLEKDGYVEISYKELGKIIGNKAEIVLGKWFSKDYNDYTDLMYDMQAEVIYEKDEENFIEKQFIPCEVKNNQNYCAIDCFLLTRFMNGVSYDDLIYIHKSDYKYLNVEVD